MNERRKSEGIEMGIERTEDASVLREDSPNCGEQLKCCMERLFTDFASFDYR